MGKKSREKKEAKQVGKCPIEDCNNPISPTSKFGLCANCTRVANVILYALPRITVKRPVPGKQDISRLSNLGPGAELPIKPKPRIILPGG